MRKSLDKILNGTARLLIGFQGLFMDTSRILQGPCMGNFSYILLTNTLALSVEFR